MIIGSRANIESRQRPIILGRGCCCCFFLSHSGRPSPYAPQSHRYRFLFFRETATGKEMEEKTPTSSCFSAIVCHAPHQSPFARDSLYDSYWGSDSQPSRKRSLTSCPPPIQLFFFFRSSSLYIYIYILCCVYNSVVSVPKNKVCVSLYNWRSIRRNKQRKQN